MILENLMRVAIIVFNAAAIPFLVKLIVGVNKSRRKLKKKTDGKTAMLLIGLFHLLLGASIFSIIVSIMALLVVNHIVDFTFHIGSFSRMRSLMFSIGNLLVSVFFYRQYLEGGEKNA